MRCWPTASKIARATVVFPEPVPPATPRMQGRGPEGVSKRGRLILVISGFHPSLSSRYSRHPELLADDGDERVGPVALPPEMDEEVLDGPHGRDSMSALAARTVEGAPPGLDDPPDGGAAGRAGLPRPAVGGERDLEVAAVALPVGEVGERRPPLGDGLGEDLDHRPGEALPARRGEAGDRARGVDAGAEERFGGIDVPHPDDHAGIHEEALDRPPPPGRRRGE